MCIAIEPPVSGEDEFYVDDPLLTAFIEAVNGIRDVGLPSSEIVAAITPHFQDLLADQNWLPAEFCEPKEGSGMGSGIGMWLLYRSGDGGLAFSSLVVPAGASTPVHDHLAWGVVGLYQGNQDEEVFARIDDGTDDEVAVLKSTVRQSLAPGDLYELLPETDIHQVTTTSSTTSVSLHLLGNDNGCIWRHRYFPEDNAVEPFKSGWLNVPCDESQTVAS